MGIMPGRQATRQRLLIGAVIVAGTSLFNLIALEFGPLGSPWPIALLWAACGWAGLGPNASTAGLLFALGLWVDVLTGAPLGTWAVIALITHAITLVMARFIGTSSFGPLGSVIVSACVMLLAMVTIGLWRDGSFYFLGALLSLVTAVSCYPLVSRFFELSEDET
jgi:hypothetical protein